MADTDPNTTPAETPDANADIVCRVDGRYYRQMGLLFLLFIGFAAWFFYDWKFGYPNENPVFFEWSMHSGVERLHESGTLPQAEGEGAETQQWIDAIRAQLDSMDGELKKIESDSTSENLDWQKLWDSAAMSREWPAGEPPNWNEYNKVLGRSSGKPDFHSADSIAEQSHFFYGGLALAGVVLVNFLLNFRKKLRADAEAFYTPSGERIAFADVFRVDKRKWYGRGIAYVYHGTEGSDEKKAKIDDWVYTGASRILDRLMADFTGELIDRAEPEDDDEEAEEEVEEAAAAEANADADADADPPEKPEKPE